MNASEIKQALAEKGINLAILGEATSHSPQRFSSVINRSQKSTPLAKIVAKAIDRPFDEVFPDYQIMCDKRSNRQQVVDSLRQRLAS